MVVMHQQRWDSCYSWLCFTFLITFLLTFIPPFVWDHLLACLVYFKQWRAPADHNASATDEANVTLKVRHICSVSYWGTNRWDGCVIWLWTIPSFFSLIFSLPLIFISVGVRRVRLQQDRDSSCQTVRQNPQTPFLLPPGCNNQQWGRGSDGKKGEFCWLFCF